MIALFTKIHYFSNVAYKNYNILDACSRVLVDKNLHRRKFKQSLGEFYILIKMGLGQQSKSFIMHCLCTLKFRKLLEGAEQRLKGG